MDFQSVPISGKGRSLTSKTNQKVSRVKKTNSAGTPSTHSHRSKRVLGSSRSTNCMLKREPNKPLSKSSSLGNGKEINQQRQPKYPLKLSSSKHTDKDPVPMEPEVAAEENKLDEIKPKTKKTVSFQEPLVEHLAHIVQEEGSGAFQTPMSSSSSSTEDRVIPGTPYYSAETCGKCRLDRLDSSSYWVAQIRLAEPVGKHFLSAAFFRLAAESNAETLSGERFQLAMDVKVVSQVLLKNRSKRPMKQSQDKYSFQVRWLWTVGGTRNQAAEAAAASTKGPIIYSQRNY